MTVAPSILQGNILTPTGWIAGTIAFDQHILEITGTPADPEQNQLPYILPGFIDLHVHGAAGQDIMLGGTAALEIAGEHVRHGTTSMLATTMTAPEADLESALQGVAEGMRQPGVARILGVHLEGPFINRDKLGAQPDYVQAGRLALVQSLNRIAPIRLVTLAPEADDNLELIGVLTRMGIRVQLGHSAASYEQASAALKRGASGFAHLFNAMSPLKHREPGMVGAALAHAEYAEVIPDLLHVHPGAIRCALRAIPKLYCVTDSTAATGMPDGQYMLGRQQVFKCMGGVRTADGTLAGSTLTMDQALANLVGLGLSLAEASQRVSGYAAEFLGLTDRGQLATRWLADVVVMDRALKLREVYAEGCRIETA